MPILCCGLICRPRKMPAPGTGSECHDERHRVERKFGLFPGRGLAAQQSVRRSALPSSLCGQRERSRSTVGMTCLATASISIFHNRASYTSVHLLIEVNKGGYDDATSSFRTGNQQTATATGPVPQCPQRPKCLKCLHLTLDGSNAVDGSDARTVQSCST